MTDTLELKSMTGELLIAPSPPSFGEFLLYVKAAGQGSRQADAHLESIGAIKTALSEANGTTGGYLIPPQFDTSITNVAAPISIVRPRATIVPMTSRALSLPYLNQTSAPATNSSALIGNIQLVWGLEGASAETEPTFSLLELIANKLTGYWVSSMELDEDCAPAMDVLGPQLMGRAVAWFEDNAFLAGDGVNKPLGVINAAATISVTRNAATDFKLIDVYAMLAKLHPNAINAMSAVWVMHPTVIPKLIASNGLQPADPLRLAGLPIKVSEQCSVLGTAGDVLLCDFSSYIIGDRKTSSVAISPHPRFNTAQDVVRLTHRVDGQPWVPAALTLKDGTNTTSPFVRLV